MLACHRPTRTVIRLATTVLSAAALVAICSSAASARTPDSASYLSTLNQQRTSHGLAPLTVRGDLSNVAQAWANRMANTTTLAHNPRLANAITNWQAVGENVGEGPTVADLAAAFWASPEHRANILDPSYRDVGIGTAAGDGVIWITVDFRDPQNPQLDAATPTTSDHTNTPRGTRRAPVPPFAVLSVGSQGPAVARLQHRLRIPADGIFGPITRRAVLHFQRHHHIRANGVVSTATWIALRLGN